MAQRLHDEGYHDEARDEIVRVLREHPEEVVPQSLVHVAPFAVGGGRVRAMTLLPASLAIVLLGIGLYFGRRIERHVVSLGGRLDRLETTLGSLDDRVKTLMGSMTRSPRSFWAEEDARCRHPTPEG